MNRTTCATAIIYYMYIAGIAKVVQKALYLFFVRNYSLQDRAENKIKMELSVNVKERERENFTVMTDKLTYVYYFVFALRHYFSYAHINDGSKLLLCIILW
jgi:hypothetical protein